jgi:hypothetical protein
VLQSVRADWSTSRGLTLLTVFGDLLLHLVDRILGLAGHFVDLSLSSKIIVVREISDRLLDLAFRFVCTHRCSLVEVLVASVSEHAVATRADEAAANDERNAQQNLALRKLDDSYDHEDCSDDP